MRKYPVPVGNDPATGNFLADLKEAGVPEDMLCAPKRIVLRKNENNGQLPISDMLWLPTD
jgi:hypothetical protein